MGHVRIYAIGDVLARYKRMRGLQRAAPHGLGRLRAARRERRHRARRAPRDLDLRQHRATCRRSSSSMGFATTGSARSPPAIPRITAGSSSLFIKMLERGLAYREAPHRELVPGLPDRARERAGRGAAGAGAATPRSTPARSRSWFFKITAYAEELLEWCDRLPGWPERVLTMQRNWIGPSEGAEFDLPVVGRPDSHARLHDAPRHRLRHDLRRARAGASPRRSLVGRRRRARARRRLPRRGRHGVRDRAARRRPAEARPAPGRARGQPVHRRARSRSSSRTTCSWAMAPAPSWPCPARTSATGSSPRQYGLPDRRDGPAPRRRLDGQGLHGRRRQDQLRLPRRAHGRRGEAQGASTGSSSDGLGVAQGQLPAARLGDQPPALLGRADPDPLLRGAAWCPSRRSTCPSCCPHDVQITGKGGSPLADVAELRQRDVSRMRRQGAARHRHDGHVRGVVVVLPPLLLAALRRRHVRPRGRATTGCPSTSTSAASSTPCSICSTRASTPRCCATSASPRPTSPSPRCSRRAW